MSPKQLLAYFDRIAEAPGAVPRLRRFILDLAVRGKLVEQDASDEPAASLLVRIRQRQRGSDQSVTIKGQALVGSADDPAFRLPVSWAWSQFAEVAEIRTNLVNPTDHAAIPLIAPDNIESCTGRLLPHGTVGEANVVSGKHRFFAGSILYSKIRPALNKAVTVDFDGLCSADMYPIHSLIDRDYLHHFMLSDVFVAQSTKEANRVAMPKINQEALSRLLVPVAPANEQRRIVHRIRELFGVCDRLEAAQAERERRRVVVMRSARWLQADDSVDFPHAAGARLAKVVQCLKTVADVDHAREALVGLAIRGRLVPPSAEEPAKVLLERIEYEKRRLGTEAGTERPASPFSVPPHWTWTTLGTLALSFRYGTSVKCSYEQEGDVVLRIPNLRDGRISLDDLKYGRITDHERESLELRQGDILIIRSNGSLNLVGRAAVVDGEAAGRYYAGYLVRVRISEKYVNPRYLLLVLNSQFVRQQIELPIRTTVGLKNVNSTELGRLSIPLPPLMEQQEIVAKVDHLMALCDRLEAQLITAQAESSRLLEAVLFRALEDTGANSRDLVAT